MKLTKRRLTGVMAAGFAVVAIPFAALTSAASADTTMAPKPGICHAEQLRVSLAQGQPADQTIVGQFCTPLYWSGGQRSVDVLAHGATYNSSYWDFGYDNAQYSYVDDTLLAGRATFSYDDIGVGQSSHPLHSSDITFTSEAYIMHQLITWVKNQPALKTPTAKTPKLDVVAHSKGSAVAIEEAGTYPSDMNALVLTGLLHAITTSGNQLLTNDLYPANQDPKFKNKGLDDGYETTRPGTRQAAFYSSSANPQLVAYDELHKDVFPAEEFGEGVGVIFAPAAGNISNSITVPVLSVVGQQDALFCGAGGTDCTSNATVKAAEAPYFTAASSYSALVIPNTGHDIALHPSAFFSFAEINAWLQQH